MEALPGWHSGLRELGARTAPPPRAGLKARVVSTDVPFLDAQSQSGAGLDTGDNPARSTVAMSHTSAKSRLAVGCDGNAHTQSRDTWLRTPSLSTAPGAVRTQSSAVRVKLRARCRCCPQCGETDTACPPAGAHRLASISSLLSAACWGSRAHWGGPHTPGAVGRHTCTFWGRSLAHDIRPMKVPQTQTQSSGGKGEVTRGEGPVPGRAWPGEGGEGS